MLMVSTSWSRLLGVLAAWYACARSRVVKAWPPSRDANMSSILCNGNVSFFRGVVQRGGFPRAPATKAPARDARASLYGPRPSPSNVRNARRGRRGGLGTKLRKCAESSKRSHYSSTTHA